MARNGVITTGAVGSSATFVGKRVFTVGWGIGDVPLVRGRGSEERGYLPLVRG